MENITNQNLAKGEQRILSWLSCRPERGIFGPQRVIAEGIGYSRAHTNVVLQKLRKKGLVHIYKSHGLNKKLTFVSLEPITREKVRVGVLNG